MQKSGAYLSPVLLPTISMRIRATFPSLFTVRGRLTTLVIAIVLAGLLASGSVSRYFLRQSMEQTIAHQQDASVRFAAGLIDRHLDDSIQELSKAAIAIQEIPEGMSSERIQDILETQIVFPRSSFNWGVFVVDTDGIAIASAPRELGRVGLNYAHHPTIQRALSEGLLTVGTPAYGDTLKAPVLPIVVPIKNRKGEVLGAIVGANNLAKPNFFQDMEGHRNGLIGEFHVVAPNEGLFVASTDSSQILKPFPSPDKNPLHNRIIAGHEGTDLTRTSTGSVELASSKQLANADWTVISSTPVSDALSPIRQAQLARVYVALIVLVCTGFAVFLLLRRALNPINQLALKMRSIGEGRSKFERLEWNHNDEIGYIVHSFNKLMHAVETGRTELQEREAFSRNIIDSLGSLVCVVDNNGTIVQANRGWEDYQRDCFALGEHRTSVGMNYLSLCPDVALHRQESSMAKELNMGLRAVLAGERETFTYEYPMDSENHHEWYSLRAVRMNDAPLTIITHEDISSVKRVDELRVAAIAFETSEGILIADQSFKTVRINSALASITGYDPAELVGRAPFLLRSRNHPVTFYKRILKLLKSRGKWSGEFWLECKNGDVRPQFLTITSVKGAGGETTGFVAIFNDISEKKAAEEKIHTLAFYDTLTGLPNRYQLRDRLTASIERSQRNGQHGAVLFLDLDQFKRLNDSHGHDVGDQLLIQVSQRLAESVRSSDTVARLGGDEFVILLEQLDADETVAARQVSHIAGKLRQCLSEPYPLSRKDGSSVADNGYVCTGCIGIALFKDGEHKLEDLLKRSDLAMYHAKSIAHNTVSFFDPCMQHDIDKRALLEAEMRNAIGQHQFRLYYQLQVNAEGKAVGAEGLIRWVHPERGMISPADFIPIAEQSGIIVPIGNWVIHEACRQLKEWERDEDLNHLTIAVNVSALQFQQHGFVESVRSAIEMNGATAQRLKLEITETVVHSDIASTVEKLVQLRELGVCLALDDFGTGYSSLAYLQDMPIDQIKIDRSFVTDLGSNAKSEAIVRTIIALSEELGLEVIAEGVETLEQKAFLNDNGCHRYQGYLYGAPQPRAAFLEAVAALRMG